MNWTWPSLSRLAGACALCAAVAGFAPGSALAQQKAEPVVAISPLMSPFNYLPLGVRNSCLVESVRFYDAFRAPDVGGADGWALVLQWGGSNAGNLRQITLGHAVAVCLVRDALWMYDVNFGFMPLRTPPAKRDDPVAIHSEILAKFGQTKPTYVIHHKNLPPVPVQLPQKFTYTSGNADVREATKVASEIGRRRATRVAGFVYHNSHAKRTQASAAALFEFNGKLCVYFPSQGTLTTELHDNPLEDVRKLAAIIQQVYPSATDIEWRDNGPWNVLQKTGVASPPPEIPR